MSRNIVIQKTVITADDGSQDTEYLIQVKKYSISLLSLQELTLFANFLSNYVAKEEGGES